MDFLKGLLKGKILGHPIHLMLVHFPAALFPFSLILDGIFLWNENETLIIAGNYAIGTGIVLGGFAAVFGFIDLLAIKSNKAAEDIGALHAIIASSVTFFYVVLLLVRLKLGIIDHSMILLICNFLLVGILFYGNFLGGQLVLKHGIGKEPD